MAFSDYSVLLLSAFALVGCTTQKNNISTESSSSTIPQPSNRAPESPQNRRKLEFGSILGDEGLSFGSSQVTGRSSKTLGSVNESLWRAALSTVEFIPLVSSDALGGVIVTDWYHPDQNPSVQMKVTTYITGPMLEAKALKVITHKKVLKKGQWNLVQSDPKISQELENLILTRARQLRIAETEAATATSS